MKKQQEELLKTTQEEIQKIAVKTYKNINTLNVNVRGIDDSSMDWIRGHYHMWVIIARYFL